MARSGTERRHGRFARRALALALLTAGWTAVLAFAGAIAHATDTYGDGTGSAPVRQLVGVLDDTLRDLARTAESVPRTLHHVTGAVVSPTTVPVSSSHVRHRIGDTPRALGRPGHTRRTQAAVRVLPVQRHTFTVAVVRVMPARRHAPDAAPVRTKTAQVVRHVPVSELQYPRAPAPYAPTTPESFTAGPAVPSSGVAGPALALTDHPHVNAPHLTRDEAPACVPAPAPGVSGMPGCSPD